MPAYLADKWKNKEVYSFGNPSVIIPKPPEMGDDDGPYWPWIMDMRGYEDWPCDWAAFYSSDHDDSGFDGIYLSIGVGATPATATWYTYDEALDLGMFDEWLTKPAGNPIFRYTAQGSQTETPCVIEIAGEWALFAQQQGLSGASNQCTFRALSDDGLNYTYDRIVLTYPTGTQVGDGHCGYMRMALNKFPDVPYAYVGYSLHGGQGDGFLGQVGCDDPIHDETFTFIATLQKQSGRPVADINTSWVIKWNNADPRSVMQVGRYWYMLLSAGTSTAGGGASNENCYWVPLKDDGRTIAGKPVLALARGGGAGGFDAGQVANPNLFIIGNTIELIYQATSSGNQNVIAAAQRIQTEPQDMVPFTLPDPPSFSINSAYDFVSAPSLPAGLESVSSGSPSATFDSGLELAGVNLDQIMIFVSAGFVPQNFDFIEMRIKGWRTDSANALRFPYYGLAQDKVLPASFTDAIYFNNDDRTGTNNGKFFRQQKIANVSEAAVLDGNYWGWGYGGSYAADATKDLGFMWFPNDGKFYITGESGQEFSTLAVDPDFDLTATYYLFFGIKCTGTVTEKFDSLSLRMGNY